MIFVTTRAVRKFHPREFVIRKFRIATAELQSKYKRLVST